MCYVHVCDVCYDVWYVCGMRCVVCVVCVCCVVNVRCGYVVCAV